MSDHSIWVECELASGVLPDQLQQSEARLGAALILADYQRLRYQRGQHIDNLNLAQAGAAHLYDRVPGEASAENRQSLEDQLFSGAQPLIGPAHHGVQQLLLAPGTGSPQDAQFAVEGVGYFVNGEDIGARRGKLQGQRKSVEPMADPNDRIRSCLVQSVVD